VTGLVYERTYTEAPNDVAEAGLSDVWAALDSYRWQSPLQEHVTRQELVSASRSGINGEAVRRSLASMVAKAPSSFGALPGIAERFSIEQSRVFEACRAMVRSAREDTEASQVGRLRRLAEAKWVYLGALADLDARLASAMTAAKNKAATPLAAIDRHGERFTAAIAELSMLAASRNVEALAQAWRRAVERRSRPELEAWAGVPSMLLGWGGPTKQRTIAETDSEGRITTRMSQAPESLAAQVEAELETLLTELRTPAEATARDYRRAVEAEELAVEAAYRARRGLMDLVA